MKIIVDSSCWLEVFLAEPGKQKTLAILEQNAGELYTTTANYYELYYRLTKDCGAEKREQALAAVKTQATILPVTEELARIAGEIRLELGLSAIDAFTLAAKRIIGGKVLTKDPHFEKASGEAIIV